MKYEFQRIVYDKFKFYIVDFYLPEYGLVIEIDGGYHTVDKQKFKDQLRTVDLVKLGYKRLLRIDNIKAEKIFDLDLKKEIEKHPLLEKLNS